MSDIKLSGEFQPNVYLDFGQGKIFSNRWAHGYVPFDTIGWKKTDNENPLYVYAENEDGSLYNTGIKCPSTLMSLNPNGDRNIKVNIFNGIGLTAYGEIVRLEKYNLRFDYLDYNYDNMTDEELEEYVKLYDEIFTTKTLEPIHNNAGINYYTKTPNSVDDLLKFEEFRFNGKNLKEEVYIRPQALCMPMIRPVVRKLQDGTEISYGTVTEVNDGDTYTITILPNNYYIFCPSNISNTVFLFADKRRLMAESYLDVTYDYNDYITEYYRPDKRIDYSKDNVDNYSGRFKINGEFADLILLHTGTSITLKAEYSHVIIDGEDCDIVYWNVENSNAFKKYELAESDMAITFTHKEFSKGQKSISPNPSCVIYCSNLYEGSVEVNEYMIPIKIYMNTKDNCFENAFYLQDRAWY